MGWKQQGIIVLQVLQVPRVIRSLQGSIEEKIYQRQITKQGLNTVVDFKNEGCGGGVAKFSLEDLKDLFSLHDNTLCDTHDLLGCDCCRGGEMEVGEPYNNSWYKVVK